MFDSPLAYALVFFVLGFVAGLVVAALFQAARSNAAPHLPPTEPVQAKPDHVKPEQLAGTSPLETAAPAQPAEPEWVAPNISEESPARSGSQQFQAAERPTQVKPDLVGSFLRSVQSTTLKEKPRPQSMAGEVEAILQEILPGSPLAGRSIHLQEQPDFGLLVIVDRHSFNGIDSVPEESVRSLIRAAVAEWQRRASQL